MLSNAAPNWPTMTVSFVFLAWLAPIVGCGAGDHAAAISGSVTFAGETVENGEIRFLPVEGTPTDARSKAKIVAGRYALAGADALRPGKYRIEIYGYRNGDGSSKPIDFADAEADIVQYVPVEHNKGSRQLIVIKPGGGARTEDFALEE